MQRRSSNSEHILQREVTHAQTGSTPQWHTDEGWGSIRQHEHTLSLLQYGTYGSVSQQEEQFLLNRNTVNLNTQTARQLWNQKQPSDPLSITALSAANCYIPRLCCFPRHLPISCNDYSYDCLTFNAAWLRCTDTLYSHSFRIWPFLGFSSCLLFLCLT